MSSPWIGWERTEVMDWRGTERTVDTAAVGGAVGGDGEETERVRMKWVEVMWPVRFASAASSGMKSGL